VNSELTVGIGSPTSDQTPKRVDVRVSNRGVQITNMDELARFCRMAVNTNLTPEGFKSPEAVALAVQAGLEIGLGPYQALQSIAVINNRPVIWGDSALALVMSHPLFHDIEESVENDTATCTVRRRRYADDKEPMVIRRSFSRKDAERASLWGRKGPWSSYPNRMLQMRARSFALRDSFPDALKGVGIREEVQDYQPIKRANVREVASDIVLPDEEPVALPEPKTVPVDASQAAALEDTETADLFEEVSK
jgi:hypothetical protein